MFNCINLTKMKKFFLFLVLLVGSVTVAQAQQKSEQVYRVTESSARNLDGRSQMLITPLAAEIVVSPNKISHTEREAFAGYTTTEDVIRNMDKLRLVALSRAARKHNADLLVGTIIDVVTIDNQGHFEITVTGYPANYTKFRNVTDADIELAKKAKSVENNENMRAITGSDEITVLESKK